MFYEMLTGTVPFAGSTPVDVMLKLVSEPVTPPRKRAPGIEITDEAERLIMKALSKDPRRRQQSMEELYRELQLCYGSVRYRRSQEAPPEKQRGRQGPIPLQKVKQGGSDPSMPGTPPGTPALRTESKSGQIGGNQPILLTKRKDRKKTLPMDMEIVRRAQAPAPPTPAAPPPRYVQPQVTSEIVTDDEDQSWADEIESELFTSQPTTPARRKGS
jgi:serine/threonine protein kinase